MANDAVFGSTEWAGKHTLRVRGKEVVLQHRGFWNDHEIRIPLHAIESFALRSGPQRWALLAAIGLWIMATWSVLAAVLLAPLMDRGDFLLGVIVGVAFLLASGLILVIGWDTALILRSGGADYRGLALGMRNRGQGIQILEAISAVLPAYVEDTGQDAGATRPVDLRGPPIWAR